MGTSPRAAKMAVWPWPMVARCDGGGGAFSVSKKRSGDVLYVGAAGRGGAPTHSYFGYWLTKDKRITNLVFNQATKLVSLNLRDLSPCPRQSQTNPSWCNCFLWNYGGKVVISSVSLPPSLPFPDPVWPLAVNDPLAEQPSLSFQRARGGSLTVKEYGLTNLHSPPSIRSYLMPAPPNLLNGTRIG